MQQSSRIVNNETVAEIRRRLADQQRREQEWIARGNGRRNLNP
jgi:hypothetical protein